MALIDPTQLWKDLDAILIDYSESGSPLTATNLCGSTVPSLDGVDDLYNRGEGLSLGASFSIAFTVKFDTDTDGSFEGLLGQSFNSAPAQFYCAKDNTAANPLLFVLFSGGVFANTATAVGSFDMADSTEHRIVLTAAPTNDIAIYTDGVLTVDNIQTGGTGYTGVGGAQRNFVIGDIGVSVGLRGKFEISRIAVWATTAISSGDVTEWDDMEGSCTNTFFGEGGAPSGTILPTIVSGMVPKAVPKMTS